MSIEVAYRMIATPDGQRSVECNLCSWNVTADADTAIDLAEAHLGHHDDDRTPAPLYRPTEEEEAAMRRQALEELLPHTLPSDAPGAWIRRAIQEELGTADESK